MGEASDLHAVQRTLKGERDAFGEIVTRYTPVVFSLAARMLDSQEEAEEVTQEVFLKAFNALDRFRLDRSFYTWLYTIALNHLRSCRRKRVRRIDRSSLSYDDEVGGGAGPRHDTPEEKLLRREALDVVQRGLGNLRPIQREVFVMRQMEGLSVADVSEILGIPEGTVKTHLHRAKRSLADFALNEGWTS